MPKATLTKLFKAAGLFNILSKSKLRALGYQCEENTEDEIKESILEMYNLIINKKKIMFSDNLNETFWNNFQKYNLQRPKPGNLIISPSFIKENEELF